MQQRLPDNGMRPARLSDSLSIDRLCGWGMPGIRIILR